MNLDKIRQRYEKTLQTGSDTSDKYFKQDEKSVATVRILPPANAEEDVFYEETKLHTMKIEGTWNYFRCRKASDGENCPICEAYYGLYERVNKREKQGLPTEHLVKIAKDIKAKDRFFSNILNRANGKVQVMSYGKQLFACITRGILGDPDDTDIEPLGDVTDLKKGFDFKVKKYRDEKNFIGFTTSVFAPNTSPLGTAQEIEQIMGSIHDLKAEISSSDYDKMAEVAKIFAATPDPEEEGSPAQGEQATTDEFRESLKNLKN